jgi:uncharacterized membrane protein
MRHEEFLAALANEAIVAAIREAESRTRAEIRVHVTDEAIVDTEAAAAAVFEKLGMTATDERNGTLIFLAPETQRFTVLGDRGIHAACEPGFWDRAAEAMRPHFRESRFTEGIVAGVRALGEELARCFPRRPGDSDRNELPDEVSRD